MFIFRLSSLRSSTANLPIWLVILLKDEVIGTSKISRLPYIPSSGFIESGEDFITIDKKGNSFLNSFFLRCMEIKNLMAV